MFDQLCATAAGGEEDGIQWLCSKRSMVGESVLFGLLGFAMMLSQCATALLLVRNGDGITELCQQGDGGLVCLQIKRAGDAANKKANRANLFALCGIIGL
jgi:hypothetical protein